ncbi:MAG: hypothetical protein H0V74_03035 [Chloroflexi bacterium]|nr:hypothetical protein [Chloroflexota bacterium]
MSTPARVAVGVQFRMRASAGTTSRTGKSVAATRWRVERMSVPFTTERRSSAASRSAMAKSRRRDQRATYGEFGFWA